jgi:hypothetical protein
LKEPESTETRLAVIFDFIIRGRVAQSSPYPPNRAGHGFGAEKTQGKK